MVVAGFARVTITSVIFTASLRAGSAASPVEH